MDHEFQAKVDLLAEKMDADVLIYLGDIKEGYDEQIINDCRKRSRRKNILLILTTYGGSPHAAYRIARCLQDAYQTIKVNDVVRKQEKQKGEFIVFVDGVCKSAGTLICLGANKIIMSGNGELGPIDTQLPTENEVRGLTSGLTPMQALNFLDRKTAASYKDLFISVLRSHPRISTKMGSDIAIQLTVGVMTPLYAQIDPLKLAEFDRSLSIATEYGKRLQNGNLKEGALHRLLAAYPSHSFVIDRTEAKDIFANLETPCGELREVGDYCRRITLDEELPMVWFASTQQSSVAEAIERTQGKVSSMEATAE